MPDFPQQAPVTPPSETSRLRRTNRRLRRLAVRYRRRLLLAAAGWGVAALLMVLFAFKGAEPDPVPLGMGRAGVMPPDTVQTEAPPPVDELAAPHEEGEASFYSDQLSGRPTASGELYDPNILTAAHRTLPLGSKVRVTNLRNGESVVVRINDRGPFHRRRVIDLSRTAARSLGMLQGGTARVRLELLV